MDSGDVQIRRDRMAGRITLNRAGALNALTLGMVRAIAAALERWRDDRAVRVVVLDGAGERAFCAGGDVAGLWRAMQAGAQDPGHAFWSEEYALNLALSVYPKPVVAFLHGHVLGGGVGLGCHVAHRVVGESARLAMPECAIGLIPDVGGTWLLGRAPGRLGVYLGLTGARMGPGDAIHAGFADRFVPEGDWAAAKAMLCATGDPDALPRHRVPDAPLAVLGDWAARCFAGRDLAAIMAALAADPAPVATEARAALARNSPLAMACTLALLDPAPATLAGALARELAGVQGCLWRGDFLEGVRAALIDKDRTPRWRHPPGTLPSAAEVADILSG